MVIASRHRWFVAIVLLFGLGAASHAATASIIVTPAAPSASASSPAPVDACAGLATQADMIRCVQEDFEAATAGYAERYRELSQALPAAQRDRLRRMQSAWLKFRTEACRYESGPTSGGSVQSFVYWRCVSRMTRERTLAMQALATCREGDIACTRRAP